MNLTSFMKIQITYSNHNKAHSASGTRSLNSVYGKIYLHYKYENELQTKNNIVEACPSEKLSMKSCWERKLCVI